MDTRKIIADALGKKPTVNVRAMGNVAALSIIDIFVTAVLFLLIKGSVFSFQAFLIYIPALALAVFMFWLPCNRSIFLCIPVLLTLVCYIIGILLQECDGWFKCFSIMLALLAAVLFVLTEASVIKSVYPSVIVSSASGAAYILYALFNLVSTVVGGIDGWHSTVTENGGTVVENLISGGISFDSLAIDLSVIAYLLPAAILFIETAFAAFMLAEGNKNN